MASAADRVVMKGTRYLMAAQPMAYSSRCVLICPSSKNSHKKIDTTGCVEMTVKMLHDHACLQDSLNN